ncbi:MAG: N-acetylmannosamine-6-phosphate 2-epimerase, partial [Pseudarthrobacter sp.]
VAAIHAESHALVMADCGSFDDAAAAVHAGADLVGTTLSGYTGERPKTSGPDLDLLGHIAEADFGVPLIAEGRIHTPAQARQALDAGAFAVVVGTAITHPATITGWFAEALK